LPTENAAAPPCQLVECGQLLGGEQRIAQRHVRDAGSKPNTRGSLRRCGQNHPGIAMVDLVGQECRVQPELVRRADGRSHLGRRRIWQQLNADAPHRAMMPTTGPRCNLSACWVS